MTRIFDFEHALGAHLRIVELASVFSGTVLAQPGSKEQKAAILAEGIERLNWQIADDTTSLETLSAMGCFGPAQGVRRAQILEIYDQCSKIFKAVKDAGLDRFGSTDGILEKLDTMKAVVRHGADVSGQGFIDGLREDHGQDYTL